MRTVTVSATLVVVAAFLAVARAATITVDSTTDSAVPDGNCGLRDAILAANRDSAVDACVAGSGADVVVVPAGTYTLALAGPDEDAGAVGDLDVTGDLEISGAGAGGTIIQGGGTDRVLDVDPAGAGLTVRVSGVSISGGGGVVEGGGVRNQGALTITDSVLEHNSATFNGGGIYAPNGTIQLERCQVHDNMTYPGLGVPGAPAGGGISAVAVTVIDSTIAGNVVRTEGPAANSVAFGGGISAAELTMVGSTVSNNVAIRSSFVGPSAGVGGGVTVGGATIRNSTISGNGALFGAGIAVQPNGSVTLSNVTVAGNGNGGVTGPGMTLVLRNTILAGNFADCSDFDGSGFITVGNAYNIDSDNTCQLSGTDQPGVDPLLAPLADNDGPTFTQALIVGSPAIDMGSPDAPGSGGTACEPTDQRGVVRPVGVRCDVGAFEGSVVTTTTTTSTTTTTTLCGSAPQAGCQPALGGRAKLSLEHTSDDRSNKLSWSWTSSAAVSVSDFGFPATSADNYALCLYDASGRRLAAAAPGIGSCGRKLCWKQTSSGFVYTDPLLDPDGLQKITLKAGASAGKGKIKVKGKGANLLLPLPLATPVRLQLLHASSSTCWEASFSTSTRNDGEAFRATSDP
jgi:CSLREA domain-containing protein